MGGRGGGEEKAPHELGRERVAFFLWGTLFCVRCVCLIMFVFVYVVLFVFGSLVFFLDT
jgi:hypothetical protein